MWLLYAVGSAVFAGITSILAKCGIRKTDSTVATAIRTIVVLFFSWLMVLLVHSQNQIAEISGKTFLFLILSGLATGASWLCYFKALQLGDINKVVPIDKSSTVLTILLAFVFLHEKVGVSNAIGVVVIAIGTFLMIEKKRCGTENGNGEKLAVLCDRFCCLCQSDFNSRQGRDFRCRIQSGHSHPNLCGAGHGLGYGLCHRKAAHTPRYSQK